MFWLQLIIFNAIFIFFINTIFCFNRTVYILLASLVIFLLTAFSFIFFEFEFLGLVFATVYVGGIAVMFLFLILTVDVRVENNEKVFVWGQFRFWKFALSLLFSVSFSFIFLFFCDPLMFASMDFYLFCNKKILFAWSYSNEPIYLINQSDELFSYVNVPYVQNETALIFSEAEYEFKGLERVGAYTPFSFEFFMNYFVNNEYIDDVYTLGVTFFVSHFPLLILIGLFLLVTTIVAVIICLNIFG